MSLLMWIKGLWNQAVQKFKVFWQAAFPIAKQIIIGLLSDVAEQAVREMDLSTLKDEQKRQEAFNRIKAYAIAHGIEARDSLINAIIEIAVQKLKS